MTSQDQRPRGPARALLMIDQPVFADVVKLALNHGHYNARAAHTVEEASTVLADWWPHLQLAIRAVGRAEREASYSS